VIVVRFAHTIFFYLVLVISFVIGTAIALLCVPFTKAKNAPFQAAARIWARMLGVISGVKIAVTGLENIPRDKPLILAANHQGAGDIMIVLAFLPVHFRFAIKKELFDIPIFGWYLRRAGYFPIDRELVLSAYKMVEQIVGFLNAGDSVLIFPEGTRSTDGTLGKFKRGSLLAALKSGAPIVPLAISGSYNLMPRGTWLLNPCPIKLSAGRPIYISTEADFENKVAAVRQAIADML
jgi:1-acyl-sn-glycerol-3-phosphate acyltransferase